MPSMPVRWPGQRSWRRRRGKLIANDYAERKRLSNARKTLLAGFTTVRDLGGDPRLILSLRDAINAGEVAGPTILAPEER